MLWHKKSALPLHFPSVAYGHYLSPRYYYIRTNVPYVYKNNQVLSIQLCYLKNSPFLLCTKAFSPFNQSFDWYLCSYIWRFPYLLHSKIRIRCQIQPITSWQLAPYLFNSSNKNTPFLSKSSVIPCGNRAFNSFVLDHL